MRVPIVWGFRALVGPPMANRSLVRGQTKHNQKDPLWWVTQMVFFLTWTWVTEVASWTQAWGWSMMASPRWLDLCPWGVAGHSPKTQQIGSPPAKGAKSGQMHCVLCGSWRQETWQSLAAEASSRGSKWWERSLSWCVRGWEVPTRYSWPYLKRCQGLQKQAFREDVPMAQTAVQRIQPFWSSWRKY